MFTFVLFAHLFCVLEDVTWQTIFCFNFHSDFYSFPGKRNGSQLVIHLCKFISGYQFPRPGRRKKKKKIEKRTKEKKKRKKKKKMVQRKKKIQVMKKTTVGLNIEFMTKRQ